MLIRLGGGVQDLVVRLVEIPGGAYVVAHLVVDVRDAMGANAVNTMAESIADTVADITGGRVLLRILTNKADLRLARARAVFDAEVAAMSSTTSCMRTRWPLPILTERQLITRAS